MTAIPHPLTTATHTEPAHATHDHAHAEHQDLGFFKRYIFSTDHKIIGIEFLFVGMAFFVLGGLLALLVRWQLGFPGQAVPLLGKFMLSRGWTGGAMPPDFYTVAFSMHATFMIFFVVIPLLVGTFGNYLIPLQIGAPDMAFPFLNGFAFWLAVPSGALMLASLFLQGGASQAGWTAYPPLSAISLNGEKHGHIEYEIPDDRGDSLMQFLRINSRGALMLGSIQQGEKEVSQPYAGDAASVIGLARRAAEDLGWTTTSATRRNLSIKTSAGKEFTFSLTPHALRAQAASTLTAANAAMAKQLYSRLGPTLSSPAVIDAEQALATIDDYATAGRARVSEAARSLAWSVTAKDRQTLSLVDSTGTALDVTVQADESDGTAAIATNADTVGPARQFLARTLKLMKDQAIVGPDAGKAWQSSWNAFALITNYFAWFCAFLFIAAYQIRLGSRWINIPLAVVLCGTAAFFVMKGVQSAAFDGQSAWFLSIIILGFSSILGAVNYLTTIVKLRCPGMTMFRMPLSVWSLFITSILVLLATPVLAGVMTMNLLDHHRLTSFFEPFNWLNSNQLQDVAGGGNALLHQHLFWFYSHPAVYIMILPAMGMVSDIMAVFSRKPIFGYRPMVYALAGIAFLGFIVWAHHMFQSGMNPTLGTTFAISTMFIAVPSAIKVFNWLGTLWGGNIRFTTPMLNALAFVSMFIIGGLSGIFMASTAVDVHIHDTYFIVAHIHYVLFGGSLFGIFAAIYYWYPKMFGRLMNETLGKIHFWITFVGFNCTFFTMHILGLRGMPRRVFNPHEYDAFRDLLPMNRFMTISAMIMGMGQIFFLINFVGAWMWGKKAPNNPWEATTLEWVDCPSPPGHGNFEKTPVVHHGPYEYSSPLVEEDYLPQTRAVEGAVRH